MGFWGGAGGKEPACQCRRHETRVGSLGRKDPLEEGMAVLQNFCLENPLHRGAWQAMVPRVTQSQRQLKQLSTHILTYPVRYKNYGLKMYI